MGVRKGTVPVHVHVIRAPSLRAAYRRERIAQAPALRPDAELIAIALAAGKLTRLPPGHAENALHWVRNDVSIR